MRIGATYAERGDPSPSRHSPLRPEGRFREQGDPSGRPIHVGSGLVDVEALRQHTVAHRHHHLDHTGHTRRRLRMTNIRLHRAQQQRPLRIPVLTVGGQQGLRLDRVTQRRPGAVRLHRIHIRRRQTGIRQRLPDHPLLRRTIRRRQPIRRTVLVDGGTTHDGQHPVAVPLGIGQPLQQEDAHAFAPAGTVRRRRERLAPAIGSQRPLTGELSERGGRGHHRRAARERHTAFACAQRLRGQVHGDQRRRTRRVHGDGRALEPEGVGQPAGRHARRAAGGQMAVRTLWRVTDEGGVILTVGADEHSGGAPPQRVHGDPGPLEDLPGDLQQQPLLRIHRDGLTRRDPEEGGIEVGSRVEETTRPDGDAIGFTDQIPAPIQRKGGYGVRSRFQESPQLFGRVDPTRKPAAHADDRNRIVIHRSRGDRGRESCRSHP
ncbi:hypothetical protein SANT12839_011010 [Streptomyces antimycoticus]|uniref:Uncharacterized protein n=1 Tax=Streptomyces antimycoticus TaxID=68175 RepID=A0A4D4K1L7_9ACTN|nr:hypothetical protein SANT12839_011010 [Streptomyces antimycoticus]